jgi:hypothetical protein
MRDRTSNILKRQPAGRKIPQLKLHRNGQWFMTRRVNGRKKFFYFGRDKARADELYLRDLPDILAGRQPVTTDPLSITVLEVTDRFIIAQEDRFRAGDIGIREFDDLRRAALAFREWAGEQTAMAKVPDLGAFRTHLKRRMALNSFNRYITKVKKLLRWAYKHKPPLVRDALHEHDAMTKAKKKHVKREQRELEDLHGKPIYAPIECRLQVIAAAEAEDWELLSFILLGLNAAMGQSHIADLPDGKLDLQRLYCNWVRTKTEELFQFTIWPVTAEAIARTVDRRPAPRDAASAGLLFRTRFGNPWVQEYFYEANGAIGDVAPNDEIGKAFRKLEDRLTVPEQLPDEQWRVRPMKRPKRAFYALRRTFATIGNDTKDKDAVRRIQGQELTGMDPHYVREIPVERLRDVTDYVHRVLFNCGPSELSLANLAERLKAVDAPAWEAVKHLTGAPVAATSA